MGVPCSAEHFDLVPVPLGVDIADDGKEDSDDGNEDSDESDGGDDGDEDSDDVDDCDGVADEIPTLQCLIFFVL